LIAEARMRALIFGSLAFLLLIFGARAQDAPNAQSAPDVKALISSQLDAFARDDAKAAFGFAAPPIQARFSTPEAFLTMVKTVYPPVYRHRSVQFGEETRDGDKIEQGVVFVDGDNAVWAGVYTLRRQSDGGWKIEGCVIARSKETSL
jgi:hypothetical protein